MMLESYVGDEYEDYVYDELFDADDPDFIQTAQCKHQKKVAASKSNSFARCLEDEFYEDIESEDIHFFFESPFSPLKMRQVEMAHSPKYSIESDLSLLDDLLTLHSTSDNITIEDLKSQRSSCSTCGVSWNEEHVSLDCFECGGYSMERPCPICDGQCKQIWRRDITMSHSMRKAHWEGECGLPANEQQAYLLKNLIDVTEDSLSEALEDLTTSS